MGTKGCLFLVYFRVGEGFQTPEEREGQNNGMKGYYYR